MTNAGRATDAPPFSALDDHNDEPMCELMRSVWIDPVNRGFAAGFARYGVLGAGVWNEVIDGWMYAGFVPLTDPAAIGARIGYVEQTDVLAELAGAAEGWLTRVPDMEQERRRIGDGLDALADDELAVRLVDIAERVRACVEERFAGIPITTLAAELAISATEAGIDPMVAFTSMRSVPASAATSYRLDDLAASIDQRAPELADRLRSGQPVELGEILAVDGAPEVFDAERDLLTANTPAAPAVGERPGLLVELLRTRVSSPTYRRGPNPGAVPEALTEAADRAWLAQTWRDETAGLFTRWLGLLRRVSREAGARLVANGQLDQLDDVIHLSPDELAGGLRGSEVRALAAERSAAWASAAANRPVPILGEPPPGPPPGMDQLPPRVARHMQRFLWLSTRLGPAAGPPIVGPDGVEGIAAAPGVHEATARVVRGPEDFASVEPGDVIVCATTSPIWNAVLAIAGAVVSDGGGWVSHTALIARELDIPAVVGAKVATTVIQDGSVVRVDGNAGNVARVS